jgi:hypothetical protein
MYLRTPCTYLVDFLEFEEQRVTVLRCLDPFDIAALDLAYKGFWLLDDPQMTLACSNVVEAELTKRKKTLHKDDKNQLWAHVKETARVAATKGKKEADRYRHTMTDIAHDVIYRAINAREVGFGTLVQHVSRGTVGETRESFTQLEPELMADFVSGALVCSYNEFLHLFFLKRRLVEREKTDWWPEIIALFRVYKAKSLVERCSAYQMLMKSSDGPHYMRKYAYMKRDLFKTL